MASNKKKKNEPQASEYDKAFFSTQNRSKNSSLVPANQTQTYADSGFDLNKPWVILPLVAILAIAIGSAPVCLVWFNVATAMADSAYRKGDLAGAEASYKSAATVPIFSNPIISRDKIANLELLQGHYEEGARLLDQQIVAHQVRFEFYFKYQKHHSIRDLGLPYTDISEAEVLRYSLGNYGQALAALGHLDQFKTYQRVVWQELLPKCKRDRDRRQIEKNILQHTAGSLWRRGYKELSEQMEAERKQYDNLDPTLKEEKYLELIDKMGPPEPYDKPTFSRSALED